MVQQPSEQDDPRTTSSYAPSPSTGEMRADGQDAEEFYDQGTEVRLLSALLAQLDNKVVLDVGAEKGIFTRAFLGAGAETVYAFEPFPRSAASLRSAFGDTPAVRILELALGASDERAVLHVVQDKTGRLEDAYHSLVAFEETPTLRVTDGITVDCRTLDSLAAEGAVPDDLGIIKIDTERNDFAVLHGMGRVSGAVVMVEYWDDLPETVGPAAYTVADVVAFMAGRGYANFAVV